jgi:hypothetical protein
VLEGGHVFGVVHALQRKQGGRLVVVEDYVGEELLLLPGEFRDHGGWGTGFKFESL